MLCVTLEGYFPADGSKFREAYYCKTEDQQLAIVQATQFVLLEVEHYHKGVVFTSVLVTNVTSSRTSYGRGIAEVIENFKEKITEHQEAQQAQKGSQDEDPPPTTGHHAEQATQKVRQDPFTENK